MQCLYNLGLTSGRDRPEFRAAKLNDWNAPSELTVLAASYAAAANAARQLAWVSEICKL